MNLMMTRVSGEGRLVSKARTEDEDEFSPERIITHRRALYARYGKSRLRQRRCSPGAEAATPTVTDCEQSEETRRLALAVLDRLSATLAGGGRVVSSIPGWSRSAIISNRPEPD